MEHVTEDLSPVKKKITVTVPVEEVEAALAATLAMYRTSVQLDGFRKGKVPISIIEKRFHDQIYKEATTDLVNVHINEIMGELTSTPVSRIDYDGGELERGKEFVYSISFEVMPEFEIPAYEGFEVEEEEPEVNEDEVNAVVDRVRGNMAEIITVGEDRSPSDGDIVVVDFEATDEKGEPIPGVRADNFQLNLGEGQTLEDFETLIKSMKAGEEKEGPVSFPADFFNAEFAGRSVTMKVKLHAIKERKLPELDDDFAKKAGGFANIEVLRKSVRESYMQSRTELNKSVAQKKLLDSLLKLVEFPVPDSLLLNNINMILGDMQARLERQGKGLESLGKTPEALREEIKPEAEMRARAHVLLMTVAKNKEFTVSDQEVDLQLRRIAMQSGQDYKAVKDYYTENNLLFGLRDRILADKAMEEIYDKAVVKKVPPAKAEEAADDKAGVEKPEADGKMDASKADAADKGAQDADPDAKADDSDSQ